MRLIFRNGALAGRGVEIPPGTFVVGRSDHCDLLVPDPGVSGEHAELRLTGLDRLAIRDLGSRNGTFVDGERVDGTWSIAPGSQIAFGTGVVAELIGHERESVATAPARPRLRGALLVAALALVAVLIGAGAAALSMRGDDGEGTASSPSPEPSSTPTPSPTATPKPFTPRDAIRRARRATVAVHVDGSAAGSGWVVDVDDGEALVLTNAHVVAGGSSFSASLDGEPERAAILESASGCDDLALLRVEEVDGLRALQLEQDPELGDELFVVGYPTSLSDDEGLQVKRASVARLHATLQRPDALDAVYRDLIQVDGAVIPGNSGGPLISQATGRVVGVNSLTEANAGRETVGYAISAARVDAVLEYLRDGTSVPGMSLLFTGETTGATVTGVTSPKLIRKGVGPIGSVWLLSVDGHEFGRDLERSMAALCDALPELGDGVSTRVTYRFMRSDGSTFRVGLEY